MNRKNSAVIPDEEIADIAADISELNAKKFGTDNSLDDMDTEADSGENADPDFDVKSKSNAKNLSVSRKNKIYWTVIAFLGVSIVLLFVLIMQTVNLNNIRNFFSGKPDGGEEITDAGIDGDSGDDAGENGTVFEQPTKPPATTENAAGITDAPEPAPTEPPTTTSNNNQGVTNPPAQTTARPTAKPPAATEPPAVAATTEPPTEPTITVTEEPTTPEPAATEPPTEPEPPSTEPEEPTVDTDDGAEDEA